MSSTSIFNLISKSVTVVLRVPAVQELSREAQAVKISPNPIAGLFTLDLTSLNQNAGVKIMDMMGRTIKTLSQQQGQVRFDL